MSENTLSATKSSKGLMNAVLIPLITTAFLCMALYLAWPRFLPILTENLKESTNIDIADWKTFQGSLDKRLQAIEAEMAKVRTTNEMADWKTFQSSLDERLQAIETEMAKVQTINEVTDWNAFQSSLGERLQSIEAKMAKLWTTDEAVAWKTSQNHLDERLQVVEVEIAKMQTIDWNAFQSNMNERLQAIEVETANIRTIEAELGTLSGETTELANSLAWILLSNERSETKAAELLKLAAEFKDVNPGKAALYYWAALEASPNKKGIFDEYITWQENLINTDIKKLDFSTALDRLTETVALVDANLYKGTLEDLQAFDELGGRLASLGNSINQAVDTETAAQTKQLDAWAADMEKAMPDQKNAYETIIAALEQFEPMPQNTDRAEEIQGQAMNYLQNCEAVESLSLDQPDIITPASADKTTAERWLNAYTNRLASKDISLENRLLGAETAQMYFASVADDINPVLLKQLAYVEERIAITQWKQESTKALTTLGNDKNPDTIMSTLGNLYAQGQVILSKAPDEEIRTNMLDMTPKIFLAQLAQVRDALDNLKNSTGRYEPEILHQLAAQHRMQAASIAMEFQSASVKLPALSSSGVENEIKDIIVAANQLTDSYGNMVTLDRRKVEDEAKKAFQQYFDMIVRDAQIDYASAERYVGTAKNITKWWSDDEPQGYLQDAYIILQRVDFEQDQRFLEKPQRDRYTELKQKIEAKLEHDKQLSIKEHSSAPKRYATFLREAEQAAQNANGI